MHLSKVPSRIGFLRHSILIILPLVLLSLGPRASMDRQDSCLTIGDLLNSDDPFDWIAYEATLRGLTRQSGGLGFTEYGLMDVCLHPDTSPEDAERILRELPTYTGGSGLLAYWIRGRWTSTATDGEQAARAIRLLSHGVSCPTALGRTGAQATCSPYLMLHGAAPLG